MTARYDIIIVGGGIAGSGLAAMLARGGKQVLLLERSTVFEDVVRGEWVAPWGVVEARRAGLYADLLGANDHHIARHIEYGDGLDPAAGAAREMSLAVLPGIPGPLAVGHPQACQALFDAAVAAGATAVRGVEEIVVSGGPSPEVAYSAGGERHSASARLVAGADGRASVVRRQAGIELHQEPTHHYFAGMLVDGADGWPDDLQSMGTEGDVQYFVFPQRRGRIRLYLSYPTEQKSRFAGRDASRAFLEAFRLATVPNSDALATARAAGPCHAVPNHSSWVDSPVAEGIVLLGDAAGYNDPITGQGLSVTLRDVRSVGELLLGTDDWRPGTFAPYAEERSERMRRLRVAAAMDSILHAEFGPEATARKLRILADRTPVMALGSTMVGPEMLPEACFRPEALEAVRNA